LVQEYDFSQYVLTFKNGFTSEFNFNDHSFLVHTQAANLNLTNLLLMALSATINYGFLISEIPHHTETL